MPKPKDEPKPERRNSERAKDAKVYTEEERAKKKKLAKELSELMEFNREEKKPEMNKEEESFFERLMKVD